MIDYSQNINWRRGKKTCKKTCKKIIEVLFCKTAKFNAMQNLLIIEYSRH